MCRPLLSAPSQAFFSSDDPGDAFSTCGGTASFQLGDSFPSSDDTASSYFGDAFAAAAAAAADTSFSSDDDTAASSNAGNNTASPPPPKLMLSLLSPAVHHVAPMPVVPAENAAAHMHAAYEHSGTDRVFSRDKPRLGFSMPKICTGIPKGWCDIWVSMES